MRHEISCMHGHRAEIEAADVAAFEAEDSWPCGECGAPTFVLGAIGDPEALIGDA